MLVKSSIFYVDSDRDAHFTDELIAQASEFENLVIGRPGGGYPRTAQGSSAGPGAGQARSFITSVRLIAATGHTFTVAFYSSDVGHQRLAATPYQGALIGAITLGSAWLTATEYVYATDGFSIPYIDEDGTGELHVGLFNRSTYTKAALGAGPGELRPQYIHLRVGMISAA